MPAPKGNKFAQGNPGPPSEYKEEYATTKLQEYLEQSKDTYIKGPAFGKKLKVRLPTIESYSLFLNVDESTMYKWAKENKDFDKALSEIKKIQKKRLMNMGLSGDYNPTIAKLILSANHGLSEKTEQKITGSLSLSQLFDKAEETE